MAPSQHWHTGPFTAGAVGMHSASQTGWTVSQVTPCLLVNRPWCFTIGSWEAVTFELTLAAPAQGGQTNWITLQISCIRLWSLSIWDLVCFSWKNARHVPATSSSQGSGDATGKRMRSLSITSLESYRWSVSSVENNPGFTGPLSYRC